MLRSRGSRAWIHKIRVLTGQKNKDTTSQCVPDQPDSQAQHLGAPHSRLRCCQDTCQLKTLLVIHMTDSHPPVALMEYSPRALLAHVRVRRHEEPRKVRDGPVFNDDLDRKHWVRTLPGCFVNRDVYTLVNSVEAMLVRAHAASSCSSGNSTRPRKPMSKGNTPVCCNTASTGGFLSTERILRNCLVASSCARGSLPLWISDASLAPPKESPDPLN